MSKSFRLYHTLRFLRLSQIAWRIIRKLNRPKPDLSLAPELRSISGRWICPVKKQISLLAPDRARFLNLERDISRATIWNDPEAEKLWLYNLHYFDDLNARHAHRHKAWHQDLIRRWIDENPPGQGNGWEPYPISLRIVNWIKWTLAGNALPQEAVHSLAVQVRWLGKNLEYHLLGNHLLANAKALVFAGAFFQGPEACKWMNKGLRILARELPEQVLPDGGHFERSPMYQAITLEDLADLINICRAYPDGLPQRNCAFIRSWPGILRRMLGWLRTMSHPDGEIVLFNDAAFKVATSPKGLEDYCSRLGIRPSKTRPTGRLQLVHLQDTGYIRVDTRHVTAFLDTAPIGPDYLPGHGHADTLTFELSVYGQRLIVDSGTSCYGTGPERLRQRSTAAHNTVTLEKRDSSEIWSGFRVARRAYPFGLEIEKGKGSVVVKCAHDGYNRLPGRPIHTRRWEFVPGRLKVFDTVSDPEAMAEARLHIHPKWQCRVLDFGRAELVLDGEGLVLVSVEGGAIISERNTWQPQFGLALPNCCLVVRFKASLCTEISWKV